MRKTFALGVAVILLGAVGALAQGVVAKNFPFRGKPLNVKINPPCIAVSASMTLEGPYEWLVFTCNTGEVMLQRYQNSPAQAAPVSCAAPGIVGADGCADPR